MNSVLIATTSDEKKEQAFLSIPNRSLLFNKDHKLLFIKYDDKLWPISPAVDNDNIVFNDAMEVALAEHIHAETMTIKPTEEGPTYHDNIVFQHKTRERKFICINKISETPSCIAGIMYEPGKEFTSSVHFAVANNVSRTLAGAANVQRCKWVSARYIPTGEYYIGLRYYNDEEVDIHFSGFDLRADGNLPPDPYVDDDFDDWQELVDDSDGKGQRIGWHNPNAYVWHFDEIPYGIVYSSSDEVVGIPKHSEVDFGHGLETDPDYRYSAEIHPKIWIQEDQGYFKQDRAGVFFDLYNTRQDSILEIMIDAGSNVIVRNEDGSAVTQISTIMRDGIEYMRYGPLDMYTHYKLDIRNANCKLYKLALIWDDIPMTQDGWPRMTRTWEFDSVPSWWESGYQWNFHYGLTCINHDVAYHNDSVNQTVNTGVLNEGSGEQGYLYPNSTDWNNKGFVCVHMDVNDERSMVGYKLKIEHPNTRIEIQFVTDVHARYRELEIIDSAGNSVTGKIPSRYHYEHYSWSADLSNMRTLTATLGRGTYFIVQHGPVRIYRINLNRSARTRIMGSDIGYSIYEAVDVIDALPETGEEGDPHYVTLTDLALSRSDLEKIAAKLRDSDRQIMLDLSQCIVKEDAEDLSGIFWKCTSLRGIKLPQKVKTLGVNTFVGCIFMNALVLNDEIESIEGSSIDYVFAGTQLRVLVLPKALQHLKWNGLANCGIRHIVIPPNSFNHMYDYYEYGSLANMLDYVQIYMTQAEWNARIAVDGHDWNFWEYEHQNWFGTGGGQGPSCTRDNRMGAHMIIYDDLDELLKKLNYKTF